MSSFVELLLYSWLAGIAAFAGGVIAHLEGTAETRTKREWIHAVVAFGGGILVAAVAFSLAPEGIELLSTPVLIATFSLGGVAFCALDADLTKRGGSKAQFLAMLMDFVPEAIALGALFARDHEAAILLALYIGAQNLPEGFNAFRELLAGNRDVRGALWALFVVSFLGPIAACAGHFLLQDHLALTAGIMSFASGGILYLVFQDIAPKATMRRHWTPALGAVLGFLFGMVGKQLLG
jgi:ZIP family zinc transporter